LVKISFKKKKDKQERIKEKFPAKARDEPIKHKIPLDTGSDIKNKQIDFKLPPPRESDNFSINFPSAAPSKTGLRNKSLRKINSPHGSTDQINIDNKEKSVPISSQLRNNKIKPANRPLIIQNTLKNKSSPPPTSRGYIPKNKKKIQNTTFEKQHQTKFISKKPPPNIRRTEKRKKSYKDSKLTKIDTKKPNVSSKTKKLPPTFDKEIPKSKIKSKEPR
jgi:hypothetical protein